MFCWTQHSSLCQSPRQTGCCSREIELGRHLKWCCGHQSLQRVGEEKNARIRTCSNSSFSSLQKVTCRWEPEGKTFVVNKRSLIVTHFSHLPRLLQKILERTSGRLEWVPACEGLQRGSGSESLALKCSLHSMLRFRHDPGSSL